MKYLRSILTAFILFAHGVVSAATPQTAVSIVGDDFHINGKVTYPGRTWRGHRVEGLLMNSRMVQGVFDDTNAETSMRWAYPDTDKWDAERNVKEFIAAMPTWRKHGLLAVTVNLQGGSPQGYSKDQPWETGAFRSDGSLKPEFAARLKRVLDAADANGMVVILGYFYFGQDERIQDETAVIRAVDDTTDWILEGGWTNVLVEICNETNTTVYQHEILQAARVHELIERVQRKTKNGQRLLVGASFAGGNVPTENVVRISDFILVHTNKVKDPNLIAKLVSDTRALPSYRNMPILINEDENGNFDQPMCNASVAVEHHVSWGWFDFRRKGQYFEDGYQSPPVCWGIDSPSKHAFFSFVAEVTDFPKPEPKSFSHTDLKLDNTSR
jgi:hypothetical protein